MASAQIVLPVPADGTYGASIDVSAIGDARTIVLTGGDADTVVIVEGSKDATAANFVPIFSTRGMPVTLVVNDTSLFYRARLAAGALPVAVLGGENRTVSAAAIAVPAAGAGFGAATNLGTTAGPIRTFLLASQDVDSVVELHGSNDGTNYALLAVLTGVARVFTRESVRWYKARRTAGTSVDRFSVASADDFGVPVPPTGPAGGVLHGTYPNPDGLAPIAGVIPIIGGDTVQHTDDGTGATDGADFTTRAGDATDGIGGSRVDRAGDASGTGIGGEYSARAGNGTSGGSASLTGGSSSAGAGGSANLYGGASSAGVGGSLVAGAGNGTTGGGGALFSAGSASAGVGGTATLAGGNSTAGVNSGGDVVMVGGEPHGGAARGVAQIQPVDGQVELAAATSILNPGSEVFTGRRTLHGMNVAPVVAVILGAGNAIPDPFATGGNRGFMKLAIAGDLSNTATPAILGTPVDGEELFVFNPTVHSYTLSDNGTIPGSLLKLATATVVLAPGGSILLRWYATAGAWYQTELTAGTPGSAPVTPGTVTSVATGAGLTGGPITGAGSLSVPAKGIVASMQGSEAATIGKVLTADGAGGATYETPAVQASNVVTVNSAVAMAITGGAFHAFSTPLTATITVRSGGVRISLRGYALVGAVFAARFTVLRDGVDLGDATFGVFTTGGNFCVANCCFDYYDAAPPAGARVYEIRAKAETSDSVFNPDAGCPAQLILQSA